MSSSSWRGGSVAWSAASWRSTIACTRKRIGDNIAAFGFFEAEDPEAAQALLQRVEAWARQRGRAHVRGPLNPSLNESAGLLVDGFDTDPMLMMPHNPPEYAGFIEAAGYRKVKDLYAWLYDLDRTIEPAFEKLAARVRDRYRIVVRQLDVREFEREIERLRVLYCGAWAHNWGFVPPTADEFRRIGAELKQIFDPRCAICAEIDGRVVACAVAIPDINQALKGTDGRLFPLGIIRLLRRKTIIDQVRLLLLGILPEYRAIGLFPLLICELRRHIVTNPRYRRVEFSWVLEDNRDINQAGRAARRATVQDLSHLSESADVSATGLRSSTIWSVDHRLARSPRRSVTRSMTG